MQQVGDILFIFRYLYHDTRQCIRSWPVQVIDLRLVMLARRLRQACRLAQPMTKRRIWPMKSAYPLSSRACLGGDNDYVRPDVVIVAAHTAALTVARVREHAKTG